MLWLEFQFLLSRFVSVLKQMQIMQKHSLLFLCLQQLLLRSFYFSNLQNDIVS